VDLPGNSQPGPRAGRCPPDPGRRRDPDRLHHRARQADGGQFTFNGITRYDQGAYDLVGGEELSDAEREELLQLCRQRLDAFRMQRGEEVGCLLTQKPAASGTGAVTARRSAARSKSGCSPVPAAAANAAGQAVAWQTPHQRALEVDHIVPMNQGGTGDLSNLQALCFRCNAGTLKGPGRRSALRSSSPVGRPRP